MKCSTHQSPVSLSATFRILVILTLFGCFHRFSQAAECDTVRIGRSINLKSYYGVTDAGVADLNSDGSKDLVALAYVGPLVAFGDGAGGVGSAKFYPVDFYALSLAIADFNRDGSPDLAASVSFGKSSDVAILLNDGAGSFSSPTYFSADADPDEEGQYVAVGDFNNDGNPDLALTISKDTFGKLSILLGDGLGSFGAPTSVPIGRVPQRMAVWDFNGDGNLDIAIAEYSMVIRDGSQGVRVLLGDGDGHFTTAGFYSLDGNTSKVEVADFNGDHIPDLVANVFNIPESRSQVFLGVGDGSFVLGNSVPNVGGEMRAADFNGDDFADLAFHTVNNGPIGIALGDGAGNFGPTQVGRKPLKGTSNITAGDMNDDGRPDVVAAESSSGAKVFLVSSRRCR